MALPAVLLKRSDVPYYRIHFGNDFEAIAETLAVHQAFDVVPILILPRASPDAMGFVEESIQTHCLPLKNNWFAAASPEIAAGILLRALRVEEETPTSEVSQATPEATQSGATQSEATPEATQSGAEEETMETETTEVISKHLAPCATHEADTAADIRKELTQRLGKTMAKQILKSCVSTTAKTSTGNKSRVLKANGKLLKLKPKS